MDDYLTSGRLRLNLMTGVVWLLPGDDEGEPELLGAIDDDSNCPDECFDDWEYLRIEYEDRLRYGDACRATAEAAWQHGRWDPTWN